MNNKPLGKTADHRTSSAALGCALSLIYASVQAATVVSIDFSEVPLFTTDPTISGASFSAGNPAAFEDTITDDAVSPTNPYLVSGVEGSGAVNLPAFDSTSFVGVALAAVGGPGVTTTVTLQAGFFAPAPSGETIRVEARLGGTIQGQTEVTSALSNLNLLSIALGPLSFDSLFVYVPSDFGGVFRIDDLLVDVAGPAPAVCGDKNATAMLAGGCIANGTLTFDAADLTVTGPVDVGGGGGTVATTNFDGTISGTVFGSTGGLTKTGNQTLVLTGVNTYPGDTLVNQGTLTVNGSIASNVLVSPGATLSGTGRIGGRTTVAGRLAPGNSPGTLTFTAPVAMMSSGTLQIDIDGPGTANGAGNYSRVLVEGAGNSFTAAGALEPRLRGITGNATNGFSPIIGQTFTIVSAAGGVTGTFSGLNQPGQGLPPGTRFDLLYAPGTLQLALTPAEYANLPNLTLAGNARAVGGALDGARPAAFAPKDSLFQSLAPLAEDQLAIVLQQLGGEIQADMIAAGFDLHRLTRALVVDRLNDLRLDRRTSANAAVVTDNGVARQVAGQATDTLAAAPSRNAWIQVNGGLLDTDGDGQAAGFDESLYAIAGGFDQSINDNLSVGAAIGYGSNEVDVNSFGSGTTNTVQLIGYGVWRQGDYFANLALGYGWDSYDTTRYVALAQGSRLTSNADGDSAFLDLDGGIRLLWQGYTVEPTLGLRGDLLHRDAFSEQGGLGALAVSSESYQDLQSRLGAEVSREFTLDNGQVLRPIVRAYWLHDFGDAITPDVQASLVGQPFTITTADAGRDALALGLGLSMAATKNLALLLNYDFTYRSAQTGNALMAAVQYRW